jgi:ABC-type multidrug transport system permease subunit
MIHPWLLLIERVLFSSFFTFVVMVPFFPVSKMILGDYLIMHNPSWVGLYMVLFFGALCFSAYNMMWGSLLTKSHQIVSLWMRLNIPLLIIGGLWVPLHVVKEFLPWGSVVLYANPVVYVTEGFRRSVIGDAQFLSVPICCFALAVLTAIFMALGFRFFKKRVDHV